MTLAAYRLVKTSRVASAFDGARRYGGRWNSKGTKVVYCSATLSLAMLEILVHLDDYTVLAQRFSYVEIGIGEDVVDRLNPAELIPGWDSGSPMVASQMVGDEWVAGGRSAVLAVPSVLVPDEVNYILNPVHPDYSRVSIGNPRPLEFDPRFVK